MVPLVNNPRYLLVRKSYIDFITRKDYHAIPDIIGKNKSGAEFFSKRWRKYIGINELIYTQSIEGRKKLIKARINSFSYQSLDIIEKIIERKNKWS